MIVDVQQNTGDLRTGELLVREGFVTSFDVDRALAAQRRDSNPVSTPGMRLIGRILCDLNLLTPLDLDYVLMKYGKQMSTGEILRKQELISRENLKSASDASLKTGVPLPDILSERGFVPLTDVQKVIFEQFHIPYSVNGEYSSSDSVREELKKLPVKKVSARERVVPLTLQDDKLIVGVAGADKLKFVRDNPGLFYPYRVSVVFIPLLEFYSLYTSLYGEMVSEGSRDGGGVFIPSHNSGDFLGSRSNRDEPPVNKPQNGKKSEDLSLLFSFKTVLSDPSSEKERVLALYNRYEVLSRLTGDHVAENEADAFQMFVEEAFDNICRKSGAEKVEFYIKNKNETALLVARPLLEK